MFEHNDITADVLIEKISVALPSVISIPSTEHKNVMPLELIAKDRGKAGSLFVDIIRRASEPGSHIFRRKILAQAC